MFMAQIKTLHEILDSADFILVESLQSKTDEELLEVIQRENNLKVAYLRINKSTHDVDARIKAAEAIIELRAVTKAFNELEKDYAEGKIDFGGVSLA